MIDPRVGDDNHPRFLETPGDVVCKVTGGETTSDRLSAGKTGIFQDGTMSVRPSGDDTDVVGIINRSQYSRGEDEFLPSLANVDDVDSFEKHQR